MSKFINNYINEYKFLIDSTNSDKLLEIKRQFAQIQDDDNKIICQGNGGSAAIASHFTVDLSKNAKIRAVNFNEPSLITCFANDFGYENWLSEAIRIYSNKNDLIILISSSGESKNMINACSYCIKNNLKVITFTGMSPSNSLKILNKNGINLHVNSKAYNFIENIHQFWLLALVDIVIGKTEYDVS